VHAVVPGCHGISCADNYGTLPAKYASPYQAVTGRKEADPSRQLDFPLPSSPSAFNFAANTSRRTMMLKLLCPLALATILCAGSVALGSEIESVIVNGKDISKIELDEEEIRFESGNFTLTGVFVKPESPGPYPVIIFNHGDSAGYLDRYSRGFYRIFWERFNQLGYACLSWDTPGAGGSTGTHNWEVLFEERTAIVISAIEYLKGRRDVDKRRIGLLGHSQAGYIMPIVVQRSEDIAFMINLSGPAMSSIEQDSFLRESLLLDQGVSRRDAAKCRESWIRCRQAKNYDEYVKHAKAYFSYAGQEDEDIQSEADFQPFDPYGQSSYAPATLLESIAIPVLAIFGDRDRNIDAIEDARLYEKALTKAGNRNFQVELYHNADHSLFESETGSVAEVRRRRADGNLRFVPEALDAMCEWLSNLR
jgi:dienelactone hydrolase